MGLSLGRSKPIVLLPLFLTTVVARPVDYTTKGMMAFTRSRYRGY